MYGHYYQTAADASAAAAAAAPEDTHKAQHAHMSVLTAEGVDRYKGLNGKEKNSLTSLKCFEQAATRDSCPVAMMWLAFLKERQVNGQEPDASEVVTLYLQAFNIASEVNNPWIAEICNKLAHFLDHNWDKLDGITKERLGNKETRVFENHLIAAKKGQVDSMNSVGVCYQLGRGVEKNPVLAWSYYQEAAKRGYDLAQYNLAELYLKGADGVPKDEDLARQYFYAAKFPRSKETPFPNTKFTESSIAALAQAALVRLGCW